MKAKHILQLVLGIAFAVTFSKGASAQEFRFQLGGDQFRFERGDNRGNDGKRASCIVYSQMAVVQAEANRKFNCGYSGPGWNSEARDHFRWCRFVRRESIATATRDRAVDLQRCFDRMGDFDDDKWDRR